MDEVVTFETNYLRYMITTDGRNQEFTSKSGYENFLAIKSAQNEGYFSKIILPDMTEIYPERIDYTAPYLTVYYKNGYKTVIKVNEDKHYLTFMLESVQQRDDRSQNNCYTLTEGYYSIVFMHIEVDIDYRVDNTYTATCMGMTLNTKMQEYPGRNSVLHCEAFTHIGIGNAKCAIIGAPETMIISIMKEVLDEIPDGTIPKGAYSGPYAHDCPDAARTYTIGGVSKTAAVAAYVNDMQQFGITQIHMHQGQLYRQGDFHVTMSGGKQELKAMINRYHELGIQVMLHTYSFFVSCWRVPTANKYTSPVPHKDLGVCSRFTLREDIGTDTGEIYVGETTVGLNEEFGYMEPESPILWIDEELIHITNIIKSEPYGFDGCERGYLGTVPATHKKGSRVRQLNSYFGYIAPEKNSELFFEIACNTADFYNEFDFDGFYLDAIDGVFVLDGNEFSWYHSVLFINEMFKYLKKPPIFNCCYGPQYPGQWYARTRMGAWDSACRGYRDFTDAHLAFNEKYAEQMSLTSELGWWSLFPQVNDKLGWQGKIMHDEDIDYLCSKMLATDACQSWQGGFVRYKEIPKLAGYRDKILLYTKLKEERYFAKAIKDKVRKPSAEFDLVQMPDGEYRFRHTNTYRQCIEDIDDDRSTFMVHNCFYRQQPKIRIEALYSGENDDSSEALKILDFNEDTDLVLNQKYDIGHQDLNDMRAMVIWLYGDGKGKTINIRVHSPRVLLKGFADHFIKVDFCGWRRYVFYEFQNCEMPHDDWPPEQMEYKVFTDVEAFYAVYSTGVNYRNISEIEILVNREGEYNLRMRPVLAVPHKEVYLKNPTVIAGGNVLTFKTDLRSGTYLEYSPDNRECKVYDMLGNILDIPDIDGDKLFLEENVNQVTLKTSGSSTYQKRAAVTFRTVGSLV